MRECALWECKGRPQTVTSKSGVKMHRFPREEFIRVRWISWVRDVCGHGAFNCKDFSVLCNRHFEKSCFREGSGRLKPDSYPTITPEMLDAMERDASTAAGGESPSAINVPEVGRGSTAYNETNPKCSSENHVKHREEEEVFCEPLYSSIPGFQVEEIVHCEADPLFIEGANQLNESDISNKATKSCALGPATTSKTRFSRASDPSEPNIIFVTPPPEAKAAAAAAVAAAFFSCASTSSNPASRSRSSLPRPPFDPIPPNPARTKRKRYPGDLTVDDFSTPIKARRHFKIMKFALEKRTSKLIKLQKRYVVTTRKIEKFKCLSKRLRENNLMSAEAYCKLEVAVDSLLNFLGCHKASAIRRKAPSSQATLDKKCNRPKNGDMVK